LRSCPSSFKSPTDTLTARKAFLAGNSKKPPSLQGQPIEFAKAQNKQTFYFNRPPAAATITPLPLLHPVFGQFVDDCESYVPTREDNNLVYDLSLAMSGFFSDEEARMSKFRKVMDKHGFDLAASKLEGTHYQSDGDIRIRGFCVLVVEGKLEIGSKGAEPLFQGAQYYLEFVREKAGEGIHTLPCFILYVFGEYAGPICFNFGSEPFEGAHIGFAGAAFTDRPNLQVLTPPIPLFFHNSDTKLRMTAARHLGALKKAIDRLGSYYEAVIRQTDTVSDHMFPHPTQYFSLQDHTERKFAYVLDPNIPPISEKLIFFGKTDKNEDICIKFVRSYSKDVHLRLALMGCAPVLRGFETIPGGWFMVVMDMLDGSYQRFDLLLPGPELYESVMETVVSLHQKGFVHGDLRDTNIWVNGNCNERSPSAFMLVDFDWSGVIGQVRYPMNMYVGPDLRRPGGAFDGELILAEHDVAMVDIMFNM
jgi:hypothetical protein